MKKSVVFIEPTGHKSNVFEDYMRLPLLGTLYLGTILHEQGYHVRVINENITGREVDPFEVQADVFCITALTVSASRAKLLAAQLRTIYPESKVLIGGIHASLLPEEFTDVADHVVVGEAEQIIVELVEGQIKEKVVFGPRVPNVEDLPLLNYGLLDHFDTMNIVPVMTSRGCPFDCNFCTVTKVFGRKFRNLSAERVVAEMENAMTYFATKNFFFYDDNFTANHRRVDKICDLLMEKNLDITWAAQVRCDLAKNPELVNKMAKSGCRWVYIGFESIDDETLKALHKSQTQADIVRAVEVFHQFSINIHGMFMFGEDHDTLETIDRTVEFATSQGVDTVQFMILTPFPGTRCYEDLVAENRLLHKNWDYYNAMFIVFRPANMSPGSLQSETYRAYQQFYSVRRTVSDLLSTGVNVLLDALVWNLGRANTYRLDNIFKRAGATAIISKCSDAYMAYLTYLKDAERRQLLGDASPSAEDDMPCHAKQ
ncbi:MAG: B12-binding domain-containing radical SAM protein [bacterium]